MSASRMTFPFFLEFVGYDAAWAATRKALEYAKQQAGHCHRLDGRVWQGTI